MTPDPPLAKRVKRPLPPDVKTDKHGILGGNVGPDAPPRPGFEIGEAKATCGHVVRYEIPANPFWAKSKLAVIGSRACRECRIAEADERVRLGIVAATKGKIKKGQEAKAMPAGATVHLCKLENGVWSGVLEAGGISVAGESAGAMGIISKLARKWLAQSGAKLTGRVVE